MTGIDRGVGHSIPGGPARGRAFDTAAAGGGLFYNEHVAPVRGVADLNHRERWLVYMGTVTDTVLPLRLWQPHLSTQADARRADEFTIRPWVEGRSTGGNQEMARDSSTTMS
jgi:hypothetical protein